MIETKDITKMVKHIIKRDKGAVDVEIIHPVREWLRGLSLVIGGLILGSWFCIYLYSTQYQKMNEVISITETVVPYNSAVVESALELFKTKEKKFSEILDGKNNNNLLPVPTTNSQETMEPAQIQDAENAGANSKEPDSEGELRAVLAP